MKRSSLIRRAPLRARRPAPLRASKTFAFFTPRARPVAARIDRGADLVAPVPKRVYVRSGDLLAACRLIPCQHCGAADGTVCAAHSNWGAHGKGLGIKADDSRVAALCSVCHSMLDQSSTLSGSERALMFWRAHIATVLLLIAERIWPAGVPVPDIASPTGLPLAGSSAAN